MKRYVPTGKTAFGGIGSVVVCKDKNLDRKVVIKSVQEGVEHRRLLDELAALQRIRSKHVVQIFDADFFGPRNEMGIVEEFIEGEGLETLLGTVSSGEDFLRLLYQASAGIADIHDVGIVHRDIKPSNMLVSQEGILKIIDFNLSRNEDEANTFDFVGTRGYAAPEQYSGGRVTFTTAVDVYALGVTAWALLHGEDLPKELRSEPPQPDVWKERSEGFLSLQLDPELAQLLNDCVSSLPTDRPAAAQVRDRAARLILKDRHRALVLGTAQPFELHAGNRLVRVSHTLGNLTIEYDGLDFRATSVSGEVWVNNMRMEAGAVISGCRVIALGSPTRRASQRIFLTMDVSHPEVVL